MSKFISDTRNLELGFIYIKQYNTPKGVLVLILVLVLVLVRQRSTKLLGSDSLGQELLDDCPLDIAKFKLVGLRLAFKLARNS